MTTTASDPQIAPYQPAAAPALRAADQGVADALESVLSDNTRRVYGAQWRLFTGWCGDVGLRSLPADPLTVARYLAVRAGDGASIATLRLAASAIAKAHQLAGHESPCRDPGVRASLKGWWRRLAKPQRRRVVRHPPHRSETPCPRPRNGRAGRPARPFRRGPGGGAIRRRVAPLRGFGADLGRRATLGRRQRPHHRAPLQDRRRGPGRRGGHHPRRHEGSGRHPAGGGWW